MVINFLQKLFGGASKDLKSLLERGAVVIDVRTEKEYTMGHAEGSINIPLQTIQERMDEVLALDKPVITCCLSGSRSGRAAALIRKAGVEVENGGNWQNIDKVAKLL